MLGSFKACSKHTIDGPGSKPHEGYAGAATCKASHKAIYNKTYETAMFHALTVVEDYEWSATFVNAAGDGRKKYRVPGESERVLDQVRTSFRPSANGSSPRWVDMN